MEIYTYRIKDIINKLVDNRGRNTNYYENEKYPIIDNFMIKNELYPDLTTANRYLSQEQYNDFLRGYVEKNDILITLVGNGIGNLTLAPHEVCAIVQNTIGISFNKSYAENTFMFYYLKTISESIKNLDRGSSQPSINRTDFLNIKVSIPSVTLQKNFSNVLIKYDEQIKNNNKRIKILEEMAENLYKEWFVRFRFPGYEKTEFENGIPKGWVLSEDENKIQKPKGWYFGELNDIASFVRGKNITSSEMIEGEIPVISAGLEPSGYHNKSNVLGQSITVSSSGANAGYLSYHLSDIWAADCSYYNNQENLWFIYNTLKFLQPVISNLQVGAAQPHVYAKNINKLSVIIPEEKYISMYCKKVKFIYLEIKTLQDINGNLEKQRDTLLPKLMSGKLEI